MLFLSKALFTFTMTKKLVVVGGGRYHGISVARALGRSMHARASTRLVGQPNIHSRAYILRKTPNAIL